MFILICAEKVECPLNICSRHWSSILNQVFVVKWRLHIRRSRGDHQHRWHLSIKRTHVVNLLFFCRLFILLLPSRPGQSLWVHRSACFSWGMQMLFRQMCFWRTENCEIHFLHPQDDNHFLFKKKKKKQMKNAKQVSCLTISSSSSLRNDSCGFLTGGSEAVGAWPFSCSSSCNL